MTTITYRILARIRNDEPLVTYDVAGEISLPAGASSSMLIANALSAQGYLLDEVCQTANNASQTTAK